MEKKRLGLALCGSYCTYEKLFAALPALAAKYDLVPILSDTAAETDTRFGTAAQHIRRLMELTGKHVITTVAEAEPLGPKAPLDALLKKLRPGTLLLELASSPGFDRDRAQTLGLRPLYAPGLPGQFAPEAAAELYWDTVGAILREKEESDGT